MPAPSYPMDLAVRAAHDLSATFRLDVDLTFDAPVTALVGPSGYGKSTTLLTIAGLLPRARASIQFGGQVWDDPRRGTLVLPEHRGVSYVPQGLGLFPHLTARENVAFPMSGPLPEKLERAERLLKRLRIEHVGARYPAQLSGGEAQRVALARAMATPNVLVVNPKSGGGKTGKTFGAMRATIESRIGPCDVRETERSGHAIALAEEAARDGHPLVVAVGGYGTFNEVVNGLMRAKTAGHEAELGLIAQGTGGDFRRSLGIEHRLDVYLDAIAGTKTRRIDGWGSSSTAAERHAIS